MSWVGWNLQSCVQILLGACSLGEYTGVQGRIYSSLRVALSSQFGDSAHTGDMRSHPGVSRAPARSWETEGLNQGSEEPQQESRDKRFQPRGRGALLAARRQEVSFQESGRLLSGYHGEQPIHWPGVGHAAGPCV